MFIRQLFKDYSQRLQVLYPPQEAESLSFWLFEHFMGLKRMDILQDKQVTADPAMEEAMTRLEQGMPMQYVTGSAPFYGRDFDVTSAVLIPRNETEELVHLIIAENPEQDLRILDIGTGSGCIPITLALEMNRPVLTALDISETALDVARRNADKYGVAIDFLQSDVLRDELPVYDLDLLISNPPYVRESEKKDMHINVLDHEPHLALFVPEEDPLIFYRIIAHKGLAALKPGGRLYFEINEALGAALLDMLSQMGYQHSMIRKDLNGRDRMVTATRSKEEKLI